MKVFKKLNSNTGACSIEEAMLCAFLVIAIVVGIHSVGTKTSDVFIVAGGGSVTTLADRECQGFGDEQICRGKK